MNILIILIKTFLLAWFLTKFEPLHSTLAKILTRLNRAKKAPRIAAIISIVISTISLIAGCLMCCSFWTCLLITHNIYLSCLSAFIAFWYTNLFNARENFTPLS